MSNVIYPMSLIDRYRRRADEWRRRASLTSKSDLKWRLVQVAETYDALADKVEMVAGRRWLANSIGRTTQ
jgi:hypothetical protein